MEIHDTRQLFVEDFFQKIKYGLRQLDIVHFHRISPPSSTAVLRIIYAAA
ncbi:hypothetical protein UNSWDHB_1969 [Dehalobacter sp. UNSWDHB]|nr:hypothetical protein DHBDCA_p826 [Dehalobacter sp. DCA]AFV04892.1 hypothetical protein DCF50_p885 [Dehalobacter sp. CF]EQB20640.1 hypothetical protein UNSWDHB_1969 [Dehalobacter sp. UNSWDHB]